MQSSSQAYNQQNIRKSRKILATQWSTEFSGNRSPARELKRTQRNFCGGVYLSQAAACDGILYQIMPQNCQINPGPGVLPI